MRLLAGVGVVLCSSPAAVFAADQANIAPAAATRAEGASAQTSAEPDDARSDSQVTGNAPVLQTRSGTEPAADGGDVVVTGSRIVRNGNSAPTPVTVLSAADIAQRSPSNVADYVNQLPAMGQGNTPRSTTVYANATGGANQLNARGLGVTRTLVLLDGRRVVGSGVSPAVDVNMLPQNLIQRVDVVTGGASAAYGSDAVAGVVNFILDTKFTYTY